MRSSLTLYIIFWNAACPFVFGNETAHPNLNFDENGLLVVHIDGACVNAGRPYGKAGYGVWFGHNNTLNLSSPVTGIATHNVAELEAAIKAIQQANSIGIKKLKIRLDSSFLSEAMSNWFHAWKKNGWMTTKHKPIKNKEKFLELDKSLSSMEKVEWVYVEPHKKEVGDEEAIILAKAGAELHKPPQTAN